MAAYTGTSRQQVRNALRKGAKRKGYSKEVAEAQKRVAFGSYRAQRQAKAERYRGAPGTQEAARRLARMQRGA